MINLMLGDCLDRMKEILDGSVDLVLADPPYGTTRCKWDSVIPFEPMWDQLHRVAKERAAIVITASQPFTSALVMSNPSRFRHEWIWIKNRGSNFLNAKREPMKEHESLLVFARGSPKYNRQMQQRTGKGLELVGKNVSNGESGESFGKNKAYTAKLPELRCPSSWQKFKTPSGKAKTKHPTQKPVDLMAYMVRTYSDPGDVVLDFTMGSGTTGVACKQEGRSFIGIELDKEYFEIAKKRIEDA